MDPTQLKNIQDTFASKQRRASDYVPATAAAMSRVSLAPAATPGGAAPTPTTAMFTPQVGIGTTGTAAAPRHHIFTTIKESPAVPEGTHHDWKSKMGDFASGKSMTLKSEDALKGVGQEPRPKRSVSFYRSGLNGFHTDTFEERLDSDSRPQPLSQGFKDDEDDA